MRTDQKPRETFTAAERQQLAEIGTVMRQALNTKSKSNASAAASLAGLSAEQHQLMVRWLAYRMAGGM